MKQASKENDLAAIVAQARPRSRGWKWIIPAVILAAGGGTWWFLFRDAGDSSAPVYTTGEVKKGDILLNVTATGNLEPTNSVTVGSEISGLIKEVFVDSNDRVEKDQELARVDTTKLMQQADRAKASLVSANSRVALVQATLEENEASLKRREELHRLSGGQTPSQADMDAIRAMVARTRAELASAKAAVAEAEAAHRTMEIDISKALIRSPVTGIVLKRSIEPGQTVAAQFTAPQLFVIAEKLEKMELNVAVAEADIGRVAKGQKATFTVDAHPDRTFTAEVKKVSFGSEVVSNVVTYDTELEVPNDDGSLRPGMTATAEIDVGGRKGVLIVPNAALRFDPERAAAAAAGPGGPPKTFVQSLTPGPGRRGFSQNPAPGTGGSPRENPRLWVLKNGKPSALPVTLGITDGKNTEVSGEGITEGLTVIVSARYPSQP